MNLKQKFFDKKNNSYRISYDETEASTTLSEKIIPFLPRTRLKPIVIVCIGTDRSTGDALGPLVGSKLKDKAPSLFHVYGTLDAPVHAVNLEEHLIEIEKNHRNPFIIGIDACLGRMTSVGSITLNEGPVRPGAGVNKQLPPVGDIHMTGIVNVSGFMEFFVLQNTRLNLVMKMADTIADGLYKADASHHSRRRDIQSITPKLKWS